MSLKLFSKAAFVGFAFFAAQSVSAATFDFVSMADNSGDANWIGSTELNWGDTTFGLAGGLTIGGIELDASGSGAGNFADAFFDKGDAGLGVCSTAHATSGSSGCATGIGSAPGDDNVQSGETLTLDFNQTVSIASLFFNADGHGAYTGTVGVDNGSGSLTVAAGVVTNLGSLTSASIYNFTVNDKQFYIGKIEVSAVPIPAAGLLLLGALGGLGAIGRRRRRT